MRKKYLLFGNNTHTRLMLLVINIFTRHNARTKLSLPTINSFTLHLFHVHKAFIINTTHGKFPSNEITRWDLL